ncbi:uncharacterized protein LOC143292830 isoform X2 [Babylonia areolata]|uniref:uncharacterized protein LOC143292830 isoform X2 n=1 Tax=Babylonia areolata TaxID=304850 RepID=UPI003FD45D20
MKAAPFWLLILLQFWTANGEEVRFGSRLFTSINAADCPDTNYDDPKNTGSFLLNKEYPNQGQMTLSMDIQLRHYMSGNYKCFRAHPVFIDCVQSALSKLKSAGKRVRVVSGYRTPADIGTSTAEEDLFASAGTSLELQPLNNDPEDLPVFAQYILRYCPAKLERIQRNLGIILKARTMHVFMGGPSDLPVFRLDGFSQPSLPDLATFLDLVRTSIDEGLELNKRASNCSRFTPLTSGQMYPVNATSAEGTVGEMDIPVLRSNTEDFIRMVQYLGNSVTFDNDERTAGWCGNQTTSCVDCRDGPVDATLGKRCTARMMTPRMSGFLTLLQKLTAETLSDSVQVMQAWDEDYENHVASPSSLHREGRALLVKLTSGNTANLGTLSQLAMCAEADFVQHNGDHLFLAMQKQHGDTASEVEFPQASMVRVDPPFTKNYLFSLPSNFTEADHADYPVLDSAGKETLQLAPHTILEQFLSSQTRYFRMDPYVVECFSKLQGYFVKREDSDGPVTLDVVRGFMTTPDRDVHFTINDHRYVSSILGLSFEIRPNTSLSSRNVSLASLARLAVTLCTPVFQEKDEQQIGVGLYQDRVYVDMRDSFLFWNPAGSFSSHVKSPAEFMTYMASLFEAASDSRVIDPDSPLEAEQLAEPMGRQSYTYRYRTPERILRSRNDTTVDDGECVPKTNTEFCQRSKPFRKWLVTKGWKEAVKKHNYHDPDEVKEAFESCFSLCGTCLSGSVYESKLEHCSNYIHWAPFEMAPEGTAINLFPRERAAMRRCACQGGAHCIEDSALFLLLVNMFEDKFRPDPKNSVEEEMYPQTDNPSPVAELLNMLYATHHEGVANIWIHDDNDITSMRTTLEQLMVYNLNVTEVKIYVNETSTMDAVDTVLRNLFLEWTTSSSPLYTREYVAPYALLPLQKHCHITSKRATRQHNVRDAMIAKINALEDRFLRFDL